MSSEKVPEPKASRWMKPIAGAAVVLVAIAALAVGLTRELQEGGGTEPSARPQAQVVTVYYFHGDTRCPTCRAIEARTSDTMREEYADEIAAGRLRFEVVNFDTPENRHFRDDYNLSFGSVVVQGVGAQWENLSDVWTLVKSEPLVFQAYVVEHVDHMLGAAG